jgi:hypothetical protein
LLTISSIAPTPTPGLLPIPGQTPIFPSMLPSPIPVPPTPFGF